MRRAWARKAVYLLAAALTAMLAVTYTAYRRDVDRACARISAGSEVAQTPCGPIEYAEAGDGPTLLSVHGAGGGFDQGLEIAAPFALDGYHVIAVSRFGYLKTPLPANASAAAQADAHACLLDALGIERAAVLGISAGGPSAPQFALRHPERTAALLLLVPAVYAPRTDAAPPVRTPRGTPLLFATALRSDFLFWALGKVAHDALIRAILGTPPEAVAGAGSEEQARIEEIMAHILPVRPRRQGLLNDAAVTSALPRYALENITAPTLAISVADDLYGTFDGARYTAAQVPGARFIGYPSGGHMLVGHAAEADARMLTFMRESATY